METKVWLKLLAKDPKVKIYRQELNAITGSVTGTLLLSQMLYWWEKENRKPFYKFKEKCTHPKYKEGDSWCEELGFTKYEFNSARNAIALKITKKNKQDSTNIQHIVHYWITPDRITYYKINEEFLAKQLERIYGKDIDTTSLLYKQNLEFLSELPCELKLKEEHAIYWSKKTFNLNDLIDLLNDIPSNVFLEKLEQLKKYDTKHKMSKIISIEYIRKVFNTDYLNDKKFEKTKDILKVLFKNPEELENISDICVSNDFNVIEIEDLIIQDKSKSRKILKELYEEYLENNTFLTIKEFKKRFTYIDKTYLPK